MTDLLLLLFSSWYETTFQPMAAEFLPLYNRRYVCVYIVLPEIVDAATGGSCSINTPYLCQEPILLTDIS